MGTCLLYAPGARWSDLLVFSLPLCIAGFLITWSEHRFRANGGLTGFEGYPVNFRALWVPSLMMVCVLIAHQALPNISVLVLVSALAVLVPAVVLSIQRSVVSAFNTIQEFSTNRLPDTYGELLLFFSTGVMATGLSALMLQNPLALGISEFTPLVAIGLMAVLLLLAVIGIRHRQYCGGLGDCCPSQSGPPPAGAYLRRNLVGGLNRWSGLGPESCPAGTLELQHTSALPGTSVTRYLCLP